MVTLFNIGHASDLQALSRHALREGWSYSRFVRAAFQLQRLVRIVYQGGRP
jgi:hypothetical protein